MSALLSKVLSAFICHFLTGSILNYTTFHDMQILLLVCTCLALDIFPVHFYLLLIRENVSFMREAEYNLIKWFEKRPWCHFYQAPQIRESIENDFNGRTYKSVIFVREKKSKVCIRYGTFFRIFTACNYVV